MPIHMNYGGLRDVARRAAHAAAEAARLTTLDVWGNLQEESPVDEGLLRGSWRLQQLSKTAYLVGTHLDYAVYQNEGTGLYGPKNQRIRPVRKKALRFEYEGQIIFAKSVRGTGKHKGFVERAVKRTEARKDEFVEIAMRKAGLT